MKSLEMNILTKNGYPTLSNNPVAIVADDFNIEKFINFLLNIKKKKEFKLKDNKLYYYNNRVEFVLTDINYFKNDENGYNNVIDDFEIMEAWDEFIPPDPDTTYITRVK